MRTVYDPGMQDERDPAGSGGSIASVSRALGIPVPTIRSWERRYGFPAPPRTRGRHRRYTTREVEQLRDLRDLVTRGFTTRDAVARLTASTPVIAGTELREELVGAAMRLDADAIRAVLERSAERLGVEGAIRDVALRSMREIGARWKAGACDVEHEHLATEAVRTWFARHLALAPPPFRADPIVLACGPNDLHTIGLEAFAVVLARRGWPVRVLGAMTPASSLVSTVEAVRAAAAIVVSQRSVTRRPALESLAAVHALPGVRAFYAGDAFAAASARREAPGTYLGDDVLEAVPLLESMLDVDLRERRWTGLGTRGRDGA
jgi:DNA-binding transcriptional MerR regulator